MSEQNRDFKGVWIPKEVWLDTRLNALEKIILTEIDSLDSTERGCYASNQALAEFCQCSENKVSVAVSKLIELGYIYLQKFDGRTRELKSRLAKNRSLPLEKTKSALDKSKESNTITNTTNNTIIKEIVAYLNEKVQPTRPYRATTKATQKHINARLSEGYTLDDFKVVIDKKVDDWKGTEMEQYLRPETLFCAKHFESYLNAKINKKQVVKKTAIIGGTDIARREYGTDKMNSLFSAIDDEEE